MLLKAKKLVKFRGKSVEIKHEVVYVSNFIIEKILNLLN